MIDEKPKSMSMSSFFMKKTAIKTMVPESWTELIIKNQFKAINQDLKTGEHFDHELSGFGIFQLSGAKLASFLKKTGKVYSKLVDKRARLFSPENMGRVKAIDVMLDEMEVKMQKLIKRIPVYESRLERIVKWDNQQVYWGAVDKRRSDKEKEDMLDMPNELQA